MAFVFARILLNGNNITMQLGQRTALFGSPES